MKLTFIGVGSAFSKKNYNSNMVLSSGTRRMMIDCGRTAPEALAEAGLNWGDINAVYISHPHSDHAGGLEELAFMRKFVFKDKGKPRLIGHQDMLADLWEHTLKGGLGVDKSNPHSYTLTADDYFAVDPAHVKRTFQFEGVDFRLIPNEHIMPSYGLAFEVDDKPVYISTDALVRDAGFYKDFDMIFHDCEVGQFKSGVHAHYTELKELPDEIREKTWLYHYQDNTLPDAKADGFAGFVTKGQSFDL